MSNTESIYYIRGKFNKETGKTEFDSFSLKLFLDFYLGEDKKQKVEDSTAEVENALFLFDDGMVDESLMQVRTFRDTLKALISVCIVRSVDERNNPNVILVTAPKLNLYYDRDKIKSYGEQIAWLLDQVEDTDTFEHLSTLKTGEKWTPLQQQVSMLLSLAAAAELISPRSSIEESKGSKLSREKPKR